MSASPAPLPPVPLSQEQSALLAQLTGSLDNAGLWWLSGYAAGLARAPDGAAPPVLPSADAANAPVLTVVYGSQTGNSKRLAESLGRQAEAAGLGVRVMRADTYPVRELRNERYLYVVISTQGDGDPPDDARGFMEFVAGKRAPGLQGLHYAVLGLGDSSYPQFCAIGRRLDERLAELGGTRLLARGDADLDLGTVAEPWLVKAIAAAREALPSPRTNVTPLRPVAATVATGSAHGREAPFPAELIANQRITGRGSDRDVRHIELSLEGSGLRYEPGDAIGIHPVNPPRLVDRLLDAMRLDGDRPVTHGGRTLALHEWLRGHLEITRLTRPFLVRHADVTGSIALRRLLEPDHRDGLAALLARDQLIDVVRAHPGDWAADDLVAALRPLSPRLYSIASSRAEVGDEAHLTVAHVEYERDGDQRWGAASNFLARAAEGDRLPVFIEANERFRLPKDASRDIIMVGPGTGVAPFRGFVQERAATGAPGRNWLLFGNPHARTDFLYQTEWQDALKRGQLHRLDLAFSRDHATASTNPHTDTGASASGSHRKTYVQHRLREHGRELFDWLENGAHLYVCGDATRMARDVHDTLVSVVAEHGGHDADAARDYLNDLQTQGRYARDVY